MDKKSKGYWIKFCWMVLGSWESRRFWDALLYCQQLLWKALCRVDLEDCCWWAWLNEYRLASPAEDPCCPAGVANHRWNWQWWRRTAKVQGLYPKWPSTQTLYLKLEAESDMWVTSCLLLSVWLTVNRPLSRRSPWTGKEMRTRGSIDRKGDEDKEGQKPSSTLQ